MPKRSELRTRMRACRERINLRSQQNMAERVVDLVCNSAVFYQSTHISVYQAVNGELDPAPLVRLCWQLKKNCYLPVVQPEKQLCFVRYDADDTLTPNKYGILEPAIDPDKIIPAKALELVLVPLVAFDKQGNRLGMGSGYYDATFSFLKNGKRPRQPYLLGLAYEWQCCETTFPAEWDIKLDAIATENTIYSFNETTSAA